MDEVDGIAGNQDRGGVAELIKVINKSKVSRDGGVYFIFNFIFIF